MENGILVVEDEIIMREALHEWLTENGYAVNTAERGEDALEVMDKEDFGLVILDLRLPGKDGLEIFREARLKRPNLKGIIITAYPSVETAVEAMKQGMLDYMPKPLDLGTLNGLVHRVLGEVEMEERETEAVCGAAEATEVEPRLEITVGDITVRLQQAKTLFEHGRYQTALNMFESIIKVAPGDIETRIWLRKTRRALAREAGTFSEFRRAMAEKITRGEVPNFLQDLPGDRRLCHYVLTGDISYRLCNNLYQCATCEFGQTAEETAKDSPKACLMST